MRSTEPPARAASRASTRYRSQRGMLMQGDTERFDGSTDEDDGSWKGRIEREKESARTGRREKARDNNEKEGGGANKACNGQAAALGVHRDVTKSSTSV
eukprot:6186714-Pleurochrysis_carterae.AAC.1